VSYPWGRCAPSGKAHYDSRRCASDIGASCKGDSENTSRAVRDHVLHVARDASGVSRRMHQTFLLQVHAKPVGRERSDQFRTKEPGGRNTDSGGTQVNSSPLSAISSSAAFYCLAGAPGPITSRCEPRTSAWTSGPLRSAIAGASHHLLQIVDRSFAGECLSFNLGRPPDL